MPLSDTRWPNGDEADWSTDGGMTYIDTFFSGRRLLRVVRVILPSRSEDLCPKMGHLQANNSPPVYVYLCIIKTLVTKQKVLHILHIILLEMLKQCITETKTAILRDS